VYFTYLNDVSVLRNFCACCKLLLHCRCLLFDWLVVESMGSSRYDDMFVWCSQQSSRIWSWCCTWLHEAQRHSRASAPSSVWHCLCLSCISISHC